MKAEVKDATGIKYKLEAKDSEIKDFRKVLKAKQDEQSEMQVINASSCTCCVIILIHELSNIIITLITNSKLNSKNRESSLFLLKEIPRIYIYRIVL